MAGKTFVGFGFGAIQAGLFLHEAYLSGNFKRLVVAEVMPDIVAAVRRNGGAYRINIAAKTGLRKQEVAPVEIFNSTVAADREAIIKAIAGADEICTALPSVSFYDQGRDDDVISILSAGLKLKAKEAGSPRAIIYTAENHNHAAEILEEAVLRKIDEDSAVSRRFLFLNTVIGKMSGVVTDSAQMKEQALAPITPGIAKAFLVEEFNRILITRVRWKDFDRGIRIFEEKDELLPFEEAKLYGHNATHALIGYLLRGKGGRLIADARNDVALMKFAREAFIEESGGALCRKHAGIDPLFTEQGYKNYAEDLLKRMVNPFLHDTVERITRDTRRKLGWNDRLVGTMRVILEQGITPSRFAAGGAAALATLLSECGGTADELLDEIWREDGASDPQTRKRIKDLILSAKRQSPFA